MRLVQDSQAHLERFFRAHLKDEAINLPPIFIHAGFCSRWLTGVLRVRAITVGSHIFVTPGIIVRDNRGRMTIPGWLAAHEVAHVRQYQAQGSLPFVFNYVSEYLTLLWRSKDFGARGRMAAYEQIAHERKARTVEIAYREWRVK